MVDLVDVLGLSTAPALAFLFRAQRKPDWGQPRRSGCELNIAGFLGRADDDKALAVERLAPRPLVRVMVAGIAVADARNAPRASDREGDRVSRCRDDAALGVYDIYLDRRQVLAVRRQRRPVRRQAQGGGRSGRRDRIRGGKCVAVVATRYKCTGRIWHGPIQVFVARHRLPAQAHAVQEQLDGLAVAKSDHTDGLALFAGPVPVWEDVDERRGFPGSLVVEVIVFGEAAYV